MQDALRHGAAPYAPPSQASTAKAGPAAGHASKLRFDAYERAPPPTPHLVTRLLTASNA